MELSDLFREHTPIETYRLNGHLIHVKRDDLFGIQPAPPLAKMRGALVLLQKLKSQGIPHVGVFDTRVSMAGQGIAAISHVLKLPCTVAFPLLVGHSTEEQYQALLLGADLLPLKGGRTSVLYAQAKRIIEARGGLMLPLGLTCTESVQAIAREAEMLPSEYGCVVVCVGTGTITSGLLAAIRQIPVYGVSCGMSNAKQLKRIGPMLMEIGKPFPTNLCLVEPPMDYYAADYSPCPFPSHPYYDRKAWSWLKRNINQLPGPVLFWNIGAWKHDW